MKTTDIQVKSQSAPQQLSKEVVPITESKVNVAFDDTGDHVEQVNVIPRIQLWRPFPVHEAEQLLARPRYLKDVDWSTSSSGVLETFDLDEAFRTDPYYADILKQFRYYHADYELSVRINSNQMYAGALMVTLFPGSRQESVKYLPQRAVVNPLILSASTQQTGTITLEFPFPWAFNRYVPQNEQYVRATIDVLVPLVQSSPSVTDTITVTLMGRFKNMKLLLNDPGAPAGDASSRKKLGVSRFKSRIQKQSGPVRLPSQLNPIEQGQEKVGGTISRLFDPLLSVVNLGEETISSVLEAGKTVLPSIMKVANFALDKPEVAVANTTVRNIALHGLAPADIPDDSQPVSLYVDSYLNALRDKMPQGGPWTFARYAQIPGIATISHFANSTELQQVVDPYKSPTPFGYCRHIFKYSRGSVKVMFQFFASAFTSARFAISYRREDPAMDTADWQNSVTRVVDVKGDTTVQLLIPYINDFYWDSNTPKWRLTVQRITHVISNDEVADAPIYMVVWVAGGPDVQFTVPAERSAWSVGTSGPLPDPEPPSTSKQLLIEKQCSIMEEFKKDFVPIVDGCQLSFENRMCMGETFQLFTDALKRYELINVDTVCSGPTHRVVPYMFRASSYDPTDFPHSRYTRCFLCHRGGYRVKYRGSIGQLQTGLTQLSAITESISPYLGYVFPGTTATEYCVSVPYYKPYPFFMTSSLSQYNEFSVGYVMSPSGTNPCFYAARDDYEVGFPVLPGSAIV